MPSDLKRDQASPDSSAKTQDAGADAAERSRRIKAGVLVLLVIVLAILAYAAYAASIPSQVVVKKSAGARIAPPAYVTSITGSGLSALGKPLGLAVGHNGRVYVVDLASRSVKVFSAEGRYLFSFNSIRFVSFSGLFTGANRKLKTPVYLAVDSKDRVWVTDRSFRAVFVFNENGKFLRTFNPPSELDSAWSPLGIAIDESDKVYVTDVAEAESHQVLQLEPDGTLDATFGKGGRVTTTTDGLGLLSFPNGVAPVPSSVRPRVLYVADSNNGRVQAFDISGGADRIVPTHGTPRGVAIDSKGRLFVADVLSHQVNVYAPDSTDGRALATFGQYGFGPGQFRYPEAIALDAQGRIYVSDRENGRVQVWAFGGATTRAQRAVAVIKAQLPWCLVLLPLLALALLAWLLLRKRPFVATADFIEAMIAAELVGAMANSKWRWYVTESAHAAFSGRVVDGVDLGSLLEPTVYSYSDAEPIAHDLALTIEDAGVIALAKRYKTLCTENAELAKVAGSLGIGVYDRRGFTEKFLGGEGR